MTPRETERQVFIEGLVTRIKSEGTNREAQDPHFLFRLAITCLAYLAQRKKNTLRHDMQNTERYFYVIELLARGFARTDAEQDFLITAIFQKIADTVGEPFRALLHEEDLESARARHP